MEISTTTSIIITQIPIAIAILIAAYEANKAKKELLKILEILTTKVKNKK